MLKSGSLILVPSWVAALLLQQISQHAAQPAAQPSPMRSPRPPKQPNKAYAAASPSYQRHPATAKEWAMTANADVPTDVEQAGQPAAKQKAAAVNKRHV